MTDWKGVAIMGVVMLIVVAIGAQVFIAIDSQLAQAQEERIEQGTAVYGNQTVVVSSDDCYETCVPTTDSIDRRQRALLITLDKREVWTSDFKLSESVPGHSIDSAVQPLIGRGEVIQRNKTIGSEYRYVGPDGKYADNFTQAELEIWVADQLDAYNGWYTLDELATSMPAGESAVAAAINELKAEGVVQQAREGEGNFIVTYHTAYAHHTVQEEPYTGPGYHGIIPAFILIVLAVLLVAVIQRFRLRE